MPASPVIIVQARMTSTRLPGKVLSPIAGRPMLAWMLDRLASVRPDVRIAVATTTGAADDAIVELCAAMRIPVVRGSEHDVLDRYHHAATELAADPIIRVTSDCPLIDPATTRAVIELWERALPDYASNTLERTFPRGLDTELISRSALHTAWTEADEPFEREHVTPYLYRRPERFRLMNLPNIRDEGERRWTVDTAEDLAFVRAVYEALAPNDPSFDADAIRALLRVRPELERINAGVPQKSLPT